MGVGAKVVAQTIALGLAMLLTACGGGGDAPAADLGTVAKSTPHLLTRVQLPVSDWTGDDGQHLVRNTTDWAATWIALQWTDTPAPPLPDVDFKQHMLIGVTSSYGGCSGSIEIDSVTQETTPLGSEWVVRFQVQDKGSGPSRVCTDDIKPMSDFILWPQSPLPVRFIELPRLH